MTRVWVGVLAAGLLLAAVGCERSQPPSGEQAATQPAGTAAATATSQPTDADSGTFGRVDGMGRARQRLNEDRQKFERDTRSILAQLDEHLRNRGQQLQAVAEETRRASEDEITQLDAKATEVREMLDKLKDASDEGWVELAKGINAALREINQGLAAGPGGDTATAPASQSNAREAEALNKLRELARELERRSMQEAREGLARLDARIQELKQKVGTAEESARPAIEKEIDELSARGARARELLEKLPDAGAAVWYELRKSIDAALGEFMVRSTSQPATQPADAPRSLNR